MNGGIAGELPAKQTTRRVEAGCILAQRPGNSVSPPPSIPRTSRRFSQADCCHGRLAPGAQMRHAERGNSETRAGGRGLHIPAMPPEISSQQRDISRHRRLLQASSCHRQDAPAAARPPAPTEEPLP
jgi:hypothetical protein